MNRFRVLALVTLLGVGAEGGQATSIVALFDTDRHGLVIAADCRVNRESGYRTGCKIIRELDCVAALAGLFSDGSSGFRLAELASAACRHPGSLREKADAFVDLSKGPYERAIRYAHLSRPVRRLELMPGTTQVLFAGASNGHLAILVREFSLDQTGKVVVTSYGTTDRDTSRIGYFLGVNQHIRAYIRSNPQWELAGAAASARELVELEIAAHPDLAGPPVSVIQIGRDGHVHWLDKGSCGSTNPDGQSHEKITGGRD